MAIDKEVLDQLLARRDPQELFAKDGLIDALKKALSERMLAAELGDHLESEAEAGGGNRRNGTAQKTLLQDSSHMSRISRVSILGVSLRSRRSDVRPVGEKSV